MTPKTLVIYHANCIDGFTAAWVAWLRFGNDAEYLALNYGDQVVHVNDRDIIIVDFSFPRRQMIALQEHANSMLCLDHHATAESELTGLPCCIFEPHKSGARMAWEYFFTDNVPRLIDYVEDHDLYRNALPETREVSAYLRAEDQSFEGWCKLREEMATDDGFRDIVECGRSILRYQSISISKHEDRWRSLHLPNYNSPVAAVNCSDKNLHSELGRALIGRSGLAVSAIWFERNGKTEWRLTSNKDGPDVSAIAKANGGGGHVHAAGFTSKYPPRSDDPRP